MTSTSDRTDTLARHAAPAEPAGRSKPSGGPSRLGLERRHTPALVVLGLALVAWLVALPTIGDDAVSPWGLLASASPLLIISIVLTAFGFVAAVRVGSARLVLAATVLLGVVLRLTMALGTSSAFYPWTYKHMAVTQYIGEHGTVKQSVDVYNNWPGLFAASAWMSQITGVSVEGIAHWFTPVLHLGLVLGMYVFARQWRVPQLVAASAAFLYEAVDFLGQDYFSPQAISIFLSFAVLALLGSKLGEPGKAKHGYAVVALFAFAAVVVTHQLTPFWLLVLVVLFTAIRRCRTYWLPVAAAVAALGYLALHYNSVKYFGVVSTGVGNIRAKSTGSPLTQVRLSWLASDALYVLAFLLAAFLVVRGFIRKDRQWGLWFLAFVPVGLVLVQGYGGEGIFRVFLFALPALALLSAQVFVPLIRQSRLWAGVGLLVAAVVVVDSAQTNFVTWPSYRVTAKEAAVVSQVQRDAPIDAEIAPLSDGAVNQLTGSYVRRVTYDKAYGVSVLGSTKYPSSFSTQPQYATFANRLVSAHGNGGRPFYLVISTRLGDYAWQYGRAAKDAVPNLRARMSQDSRWRAVAQNSDAVVFELVSSTR